jgi:cob(I)alamin adenosyltransferase
MAFPAGPPTLYNGAAYKEAAMGGERLSRGCVQVYTGDGKGKTTAALGLALRASGHGMRTYIGQFIKGQPSGELAALRDHPLVTVEQYGEAPFIRREDVTPEHIAHARRGLERARAAMVSGEYAIVVLDEINVALWFGLLDEADVLAFLDDMPGGVEVVLTGRRAPEAIIRRADLVTEMRPIKHHFEQGVPARRGIEH